ncbi:MAG: argininosuccinate synthase [Candidatus Muproteobacteria bacterium RIFCSPHIGHO2_12_FULL_60_33]|uniref:Argininosuccinate synthase n=1 Tax=Candidatus Muproteobacteria bacterium RIFCSPLOWO2_01_FULL_60_18 TaxID=1817768 RepID=A0A1F6TWS4_9PROT|nr:MAG: argininosuccinate synthase [Candidatus Muproteobacteria bacterium RIFCSPLOWO2_01_FULL_60_18]OGI53469.1 MAG: argininosuccinate synthase [Candidatus Muproteobacteria bacterium RIFCSPHIGHO2_01_60_12]OGI53522.1 MAG: argininosuccinate synthase [Candidatus Muproteobacteria bacterium RIFCSPHIGHO2_12_FULL_60_33]OGI56519.1 MAG: argininosuccinate synthase [Candidatus Muproteobacteria bacterium RIFCSPHIGHO2_02_FULL_60_13]OGI59204.1 MAG: argininosuccinate synthase [Candidatus Muproteobacteria bacte
MPKIKKVVLAYSGGLDTSVILRWLEETYGCEVVTFTADIGQGEELEPARVKARKMGVKEIFIDDLKEEFVRDFVFPMFRANTLYEGEYLLGTSIARPLIAKRQIEIANKIGADAVAHGATGKGNDQVRFELGYYALRPDIRIIAPWREWDLTSREKLMAYSAKRDIPVEMKRGKKSPYSMDANLLHISYEGGILEDPWKEPEASMWRWSVSPEKAPNKPTYIELTYKGGDIVAINGKAMSPATMLATLNKIGGANGIGRTDIVENRYVGMKSRGAYETPGGTIMLKAHRAIESITLDREVAHLKDDLMPRYAALIYNGYWWSPERRMLQQMIDASQATVNGVVRLKLYKGNVTVVGRKSDSDSLFDATIATFEEDKGAYDQKDAEGFIKLNALRLRIAAKRRKKK